MRKIIGHFIIDNKKFNIFNRYSKHGSVNYLIGKSNLSFFKTIELLSIYNILEDIYKENADHNYTKCRIANIYENSNFEECFEVKILTEMGEKELNEFKEEIREKKINILLNTK